MIGIIGKKCGMTRVFTDDGKSVPVTIIQANPNQINRIKTLESDGYFPSLNTGIPDETKMKLSKIILDFIIQIFMKK